MRYLQTGSAILFKFVRLCHGEIPTGSSQPYLHRAGKENTGKKLALKISRHIKDAVDSALLMENTF